MASSIRYDPARELQIVQSLDSTTMRRGEPWYLIDLPWLQRWLVSDAG